ncbi:class I SAM-dependent methyltransferase [Thermodesulforhabdus norvegica]|uniref:Ubiquinone/menaquinone biosynthesis C-methylase UbiE n=1 Tax=Thermodesulforhabdus norvegica TaxID=39841 RepID=A0A1I4T644_9BACT|nr:class I SAM-dependent methyltransferase [Thermodesulforhabdus norvegica]SFM72176.1 Ubiquinone/menaquinone biosynthesis C-methylase UbiE [Thermodesulforhabdus norvegica]
MTSNHYFDRVASDWDRMRRGFFSEEVREKAISIAGVRSDAVAADIGAGTGFITEGLVNRGLRVIAVDRSGAMLAGMRRKLAGVSGVDYLVGEVTELPISDESVDYAFANMCLHHIELPYRAIKEMARILRPGGKLIITDLDEHSHDFLRIEHHDAWLGFKSEHMKEWLAEAGLREVSVKSLGENCCAQPDCGCASVGIFIATGLK